tara:strand:+ start:15938 stop:16207 length:270 start_codon:yes stop_codon:yes gene_type:complete
MAYSATSLTRLAGGSGVTLWHYTTTDTIATVNTAGYFSDSANMFNGNDVIIAVTSTGGTPAVTITYANSVTASAVDVVDGLTVTATDSD